VKDYCHSKVKSDGSYCPLFSPIISLQTLNVAVSGSGSGSSGGVGGPISLITPSSVAAEAVQSKSASPTSLNVCKHH
jgi:hypothetical protein